MRAEEREMGECAAGSFSHLKRLFRAVLHELLEGAALSHGKKMWMRVTAGVGLTP
jgi:hypothetical protein